MHSRRLARAAGVLAFVVLGGAAGAPSASGQSLEFSVMPYAGILPMEGLAGGVQVEASREGSPLLFTLGYTRWAHGLACSDAAVDIEPGPGGEPDFGSSRCGEEGQTFLGGLMYRYGAADARLRPYLGLGLGVAEAIGGPDGLEPAGAVEGGVDIWPASFLSLRLGLRADGRFSVGHDYIGPVVGIRLSF